MKINNIKYENKRYIHENKKYKKMCFAKKDPQGNSAHFSL